MVIFLHLRLSANVILEDTDCLPLFPEFYLLRLGTTFFHKTRFYRFFETLERLYRSFTVPPICYTLLRLRKKMRPFLSHFWPLPNRFCTRCTTLKRDQSIGGEGCTRPRIDQVFYDGSDTWNGKGRKEGSRNKIWFTLYSVLSAKANCNNSPSSSVHVSTRKKIVTVERHIKECWYLQRVLTFLFLQTINTFVCVSYCFACPIFDARFSVSRFPHDIYTIVQLV